MLTRDVLPLINGLIKPVFLRANSKTTVLIMHNTTEIYMCYAAHYINRPQRKMFTWLLSCHLKWVFCLRYFDFFFGGGGEYRFLPRIILADLICNQVAIHWSITNINNWNTNRKQSSLKWIISWYFMTPLSCFSFSSIRREHYIFLKSYVQCLITVYKEISLKLALVFLLSKCQDYYELARTRVSSKEVSYPPCLSYPRSISSHFYTDKYDIQRFLLNIWI